VVDRLNSYHSKTKPVLEYYKKMSKKGDVQYHVIHGLGEVDEITNQIIIALME